MKDKVLLQAQLLLGRCFFKEVKPKEFIAWSRLAISNGYDTLSLEGLAHGNKNSNARVIMLFQKTLKEINPETFNDRLEIFQIYAFSVAQEYIHGKRTLQNALGAFLKIYHETESYKTYKTYVPFYNLCLDSKLLLEPSGIIKLEGKLEVKVSGIFKARLIEFLAENSEVDYRVELGRKSNEQLVFMKFYNNGDYDFVALIVLDEILRIRGITGDRLARMKEQLSDVK